MEKLEEVEERARGLYDCNQRLEAHVHDLESRKRAPLYQKKQVSGVMHGCSTTCRCSTMSAVCCTVLCAPAAWLALACVC